MLCMGFDVSWVNKILLCVSSGVYTIKHNGIDVGTVSPERGLRQGDPLSPYLFILCTEGLSALLKKMELQNRIHGCCLVRNSPSINHLFFADDSFLFFQVTTQKCEIIKHCL